MVGMWRIVTGSILDVNTSNGVLDRLAADFVADATALTLGAVTTAFVGPGSAPSEIHWRADGQGWVMLAPPGTQVAAGDDDHDFFDLPKLLWPHRYTELAEVCDSDQPTMVLSRAGAQLLGNGRAHLVTVTVDHDLGLIRSYRSEAADGTTLRTVELTYTTG
jgi:hypothetical protein